MLLFSDLSSRASCPGIRIPFSAAKSRVSTTRRSGHGARPRAHRGINRAPQPGPRHHFSTTVYRNAAKIRNHTTTASHPPGPPTPHHLSLSRQAAPCSTLLWSLCVPEFLRLGGPRHPRHQREAHGGDFAVWLSRRRHLPWGTSGSNSSGSVQAARVINCAGAGRFRLHLASDPHISLLVVVSAAGRVCDPGRRPDLRIQLGCRHFGDFWLLVVIRRILALWRIGNFAARSILTSGVGAAREPEVEILLALAIVLL